MKDLKKKLNAFMQVCYHLMVGNQPKTQEESYICICDTLVMFRYAPTTFLIWNLVSTF